MAVLLEEKDYRENPSGMKSQGRMDRITAVNLTVAQAGPIILPRADPRGQK